MKIDIVHQTVNVYRKLVRAFSYPGELVDICANRLITDYEQGFQWGLQLLGVTLLDKEVKTYFDKGEDFLQIHQRTFCDQSPPEEADFLFFTDAQNLDHGRESLQKAQRGSLIDPHKGATAIIHCPDLNLYTQIASENSGTSILEMKGPGIKTTQQLIIPMDKLHQLWWIDIREDLCSEFPMGIDLILFDNQCHVIAIPRTTKVSLLKEVK